MSSHVFPRELVGCQGGAGCLQIWSDTCFPVCVPLDVLPFTCFLSLADQTLSSFPSIFLQTCITTPIRAHTRHMPLVVGGYVKTTCFFYYIVICRCQFLCWIFFFPNTFKQSHVSRNRASSRHTTLKVTLSLSSPRRSQSFPAGDGHLPGPGRSLLSLWLLLSFLVSVFQLASRCCDEALTEKQLRGGKGLF